MSDAPTAIDNLLEAAQRGLEAGKEVSINAIGTRGWVGIQKIGRDRPGASLIAFTGAWAENEGALFWIPADALLAVRVAEPKS